jgi:hypothetical protein
MNHPNCGQDCINCPFLPDPYDPNRYVCIKCKREYRFNSFTSGSGWGALLLFLTIAILMALALTRDSPPQPGLNEGQLPQRGQPGWQLPSENRFPPN